MSLAVAELEAMGYILNYRIASVAIPPTNAHDGLGSVRIAPQK